MKKFIVLLSAGLLILAFAATGFAQDKLDFRVSGMVDIQSHNTVNVPGLNASATPIFNSANGFYTLAWPLNARVPQSLLAILRRPLLTRYIPYMAYL